MTLLRLNSVADLPTALKGGVVAIGNFDGIHKGHAAVLDKALSLARAAGVPALVLTFEPHPRSVFNPAMPVFRLTPAALKADILRRLGFDAVVEHPFDRAFASHSAEDFVSAVLKDGFALREAVTGFDFHFGKGREGGPAFLMEAGRRHGFVVTLVDALRDATSEPVSSSRIRQALSDGDVEAAADLLNHRFRLQAEVSHGRQLGRTLGYPTANMALPPETALAHGIYAVRFRRADGSLHDGVASFGRRPTVEDHGAPLLETFLFEFAGDLYGETAIVTLFKRLRGEEKFDGLDALVAQMNRDSDRAKAVLAAARPLSPLDAALNFLP
ncbi:MAG: bifunctional riboflavin kinase/FAD synthetase [Rhizobiaceae bacterium]|jgi:riboflavin kinase/FMN adenylyltransferase|nr:bifunctional riboflavin kinase/FAD synthetase [Rhizobiaceae bacterium]